MMLSLQLTSGWMESVMPTPCGKVQAGAKLKLKSLFTEPVGALPTGESRRSVNRESKWARPPRPGRRNLDRSPSAESSKVPTEPKSSFRDIASFQPVSEKISSNRTGVSAAAKCVVWYSSTDETKRPIRCCRHSNSDNLLCRSAASNSHQGCAHVRWKVECVDNARTCGRCGRQDRGGRCRNSGPCRRCYLRSGRRHYPARLYRRAYTPLDELQRGLETGGVESTPKDDPRTDARCDRQCEDHPHGGVHDCARRRFAGFHRHWI